ncbi:MAG TPA: hypothetical protein VMU92_01735, partial [Acidobacteriaceae bacterium]|nr:hypothetical protein [Acidobacteriaceae bacterium]
LDADKNGFQAQNENRNSRPNRPKRQKIRSETKSESGIQGFSAACKAPRMDGFNHWPEGQFFCRASLKRGGRLELLGWSVPHLFEIWDILLLNIFQIGSTRP